MFNVKVLAYIGWYKSLLMFMIGSPASKL